MNDSVERLYAAVIAARDRDPALSRTSKLFQDGVQKMAKKLAEEAIEVGLDAVQSQREAMILESADLLYNLCVIWAACGVTPAEVDQEIDRRERLFGIAEKLPKVPVAAIPRSARSPAIRGDVQTKAAGSQRRRGGA
jgi:phosphoribosyl-ATP pyrophosphohydrolase